MNIGRGKKVNIEYVSANPTGPMHIGHARGAVFGDVLANIKKQCGYDVSKEYYINDAGSQIDILIDSFILRYKEIITKKEISIPEGMYPGKYLKHLALDVYNEHGTSLIDNYDQDLSEIKREKIKNIVIDKMMKIIKADLNDIGVYHDVFFSETSLHKNKKISNTIDLIKKHGLVYYGILPPPKGKTDQTNEEIHNNSLKKQLLFASSKYGDDSDRPLEKSPGVWSYFAADVAYAQDKIERGFKELIYILGADHTGYIKRLESVINALSDNYCNRVIDTSNIKNKNEKNNQEFISGFYDPDEIYKYDFPYTDEIDPSKRTPITPVITTNQLVNFIKDGKPYKMSKRSGNFMTVRDVLDEVGRDVLRFIMITRKSDIVIDFDFDKVKQQSKDNPIFYIQYAHARTNSILRLVEKNNQEAFKIFKSCNADLSLIKTEEEIHFIKLLSSWPKIIEAAAKYHEPHRLAYYLINVASNFHSIWHLGKTKDDYRFNIQDNANLTAARLTLVKAAKKIIKKGLELIGIEAVDSM
ncbi:MAG TPA: arginine--tRNA ligase [Candidatus Megaira endosymbiont of Hartmannula sinica]|nr:arginine--tRNA ligase [Candidatus Megaera endosymbiont of Hartmannula sinica]